MSYTRLGEGGACKIYNAASAMTRGSSTQWEIRELDRSGRRDYHNHPTPFLERTMSTSVRLHHIRSFLAVAVLVAAGGFAIAAEVKVTLTGAEETPPVATSATGTGSITIAADKTVRGTIKTTGIEGTVAHIHVGAPGQSGPPIITLEKGADGSWSVPAGSKLTDEQYASFKAGQLYVNVHSAEHKAGEIRGQLKP